MKSDRRYQETKQRSIKCLNGEPCGVNFCFLTSLSMIEKNLCHTFVRRSYDFVHNFFIRKSFTRTCS